MAKKDKETKKEEQEEVIALSVDDFRAKFELIEKTENDKDYNEAKESLFKDVADLIQTNQDLVTENTQLQESVKVLQESDSTKVLADKDAEIQRLKFKAARRPGAPRGMGRSR